MRPCETVAVSFDHDLVCLGCPPDNWLGVAELGARGRREIEVCRYARFRQQYAGRHLVHANLVGTWSQHRKTAADFVRVEKFIGQAVGLRAAHGTRHQIPVRRANQQSPVSCSTSGWLGLAPTARTRGAAGARSSDARSTPCG